MKIIIFGVARSGTTALYSLLQKILTAHAGPGIDFLYEPLLRRKEYFNGLYNDVTDNFKSIESISFDGIATHLNLPLFIHDPIDYEDNPYLHQLLHSPGNKPHLLIKFIRANGRFKLLRHICPEAKFIFIVRNPADVINSILGRFSFFGGEFHWDDFPRFAKEITRLDPQIPPPGDHVEEIHKCALYWYYMNRFVFDNTDPSDPDTLLVCHENIAANQPGTLMEICRFLDIPYKEQYSELIKTRVGPVTRRFLLSGKELQVVKEYSLKYVQMLESRNIRIPVGIDHILEKYQVASQDIPRERPFYGLHIRAMQREYQALLAEKNRSIKQLEKQLRQCRKG